jgi:drug/metabolite transporter (DMT)-like permease
MPVAVYSSFLYLALVSQLLGFFVWNRGLALGGIARVSQTQLLQPFITLAASALLLSEPINRQTVIFAFMVAVSVGIGKRMPVHQSA